MNIIEAIEDKRFFRPLFKDVETWGSWMTFLQALFGLPIDNMKTFQDCMGLKKVPGDRYREAFVICGRRSGKSFISSIIAVYLATFKDWSKTLSPGERGYVFVIANDKRQARIIKDYISGILKSSASFKKLVSRELTEEIELKNQASIMVKTCSYRTLRGYTLLAAILEEIAFWRSEDSANPDKEILAAVRPALATIPDSLLIGISSPYSRRGVLFEQWKKHFGKVGGPLIWKAATQQMNPTIDKNLIKLSFDDDPSAAASEWKAEWRKDLEQLLPLEAVESVIVPDRIELPRVRSVDAYYAFIDPSGGRQDYFTLAISHKDYKSKKVILDLVREVKPPFSPEEVVKEFSKIIKSYQPLRVKADHYGGEWILDSFRRSGIQVRNSELTKSEIYLEFLPMVNSCSVELLDNERLKEQLTSLERKTRSGGRDLVDNFFGHDDLANAVAGVCVVTERRQRRRIRIHKLT